MPPYKESDLGPRENQKFIRLGEELYIDSARTQHRQVAIFEGILDSMIAARLDDPTRVDAGLLVVRDNSIDVFGESLTLGIEHTVARRLKTVEIFQRQSPNHIVTGDTNSK